MSAETSRETITIDYQEPPGMVRVLVRGATADNGAAAILAGLGWYWLPSAQAYATADSNPARAALRACLDLQDAGFTVKLMGGA